MFESMTDRIAGTLLMGLDVAVEFATLGEFRLVEADGLPAPDDFVAAPLMRRPSNLVAVAPNRQLLPPASTAIARAAAESAARAAARRSGSAQGRWPTPSLPLRPRAAGVVPSPARRRAAGPARAGSPPARVPAKTHPRKRAGAVEAGTQLCLFSR
jgi:hypothetical protein